MSNSQENWFVLPVEGVTARRCDSSAQEDVEACHRRYRIELSLARTAGTVRVAGELDVLAHGSLTKLFTSLEAISAPVVVDMVDVTFLDSSGLTPIIDSSIRRRNRGLPGITLSGCSQAARRLLEVTGVRGDPELDLKAWERLSARGIEGCRRR